MRASNFSAFWSKMMILRRKNDKIIYLTWLHPNITDFAVKSVLEMTITWVSMSWKTANSQDELLWKNRVSDTGAPLGFRSKCVKLQLFFKVHLIGI
jgi:hypothetical protein